MGYKKDNVLFFYYKIFSQLCLTNSKRCLCGVVVSAGLGPRPGCPRFRSCPGQPLLHVFPHFSSPLKYCQMVAAVAQKNFKKRCLWHSHFTRREVVIYTLHRHHIWYSETNNKGNNQVIIYLSSITLNGTKQNENCVPPRPASYLTELFLCNCYTSSALLLSCSQTNGRRIMWLIWNHKWAFMKKQNFKRSLFLIYASLLSRMNTAYAHHFVQRQRAFTDKTTRCL